MPLHENKSARRLFIVSGERFGPTLLGPASRQLELAQGGLDAGIETILVGGVCEIPLPEGLAFRSISTFRLEELSSEDALIVSAYMPGRWLHGLVRSRRSFHVDLYCVTATEILPGLDELSGRKAWLQRWRRVLRYAYLCSRAERIYVSSSLQTALLGGMFFALPGRTAQRLAFNLPSKTSLLPMSIRAETATGSSSPYPPVLQGMPIFLWGGGIWKWFDVETLLEAFSILRRSGSPAMLFFLTGGNLSRHADQDAPHFEARRMAEAKGLLGVNVFFNEHGVSPSELTAYLEHCHAGILANGEHLESTASWRTRQLDLLRAGRPAIVGGEDPLSRRMADAGAAWICPGGDAVALASLVESSLDPDSHRGACEASRLLARRMSGESAARRVAEFVADPKCFRSKGQPPDRSWLLRYISGL